LLSLAFPDESVFVATPHRFQRQAVRAAIRASGTVDLAGPDIVTLARATSRLSLGSKSPSPSKHLAEEKVIVDTVERLQGSEASFVICCFAHTHLPTLLQDLHFLLSRRRINVAISRAKTLCIVLTSDGVLRPPVQILADPDNAQGYAFLRAFEERAWSGYIDVDPT